MIDAGLSEMIEELLNESYFCSSSKGFVSKLISISYETKIVEQKVEILSIHVNDF